MEPIAELLPLDGDSGSEAVSLEDLSDSTVERSVEDEAKEVLSAQGPQMWTQCYEKSIVPLLLLSKALRLLWANAAFENLFGAQGSYFGEYLPRFFGDSFSDEGRTQIYQQISSADYSHSWKGVVAKRTNRGLDLVSQLLVLPVHTTLGDTGDPVAYVALVDDISEHHRKMLQDTFKSLLEASKLKDHDTGNHVQRVGRYCQFLAERLAQKSQYGAIDLQYVRDIADLGTMHDVGKIGTSDDILNKAGPLTDGEWEQMKHHTISGGFLLSTYPNPMARQIALSHHERWDGDGYPYGLSGPTIPLAARIVAIADVYDALRATRAYKDAFDHSATVDAMVSEAGTHFDPDLIQHFESVEQDFAAIFADLAD